MARTPPPPRPADLTPAQMKAAIVPLTRRIAEIEDFDPRGMKDRRDPNLQALEKAIEGTLADIFGPDTIEFRRYRDAFSLDMAPHNIYGVPLGEVIDGIIRGKERSAVLLRQIIKSFEEKLGDAGETEAGRALRAYEGMDLHPDIADAAGDLYRDGHYASAILDAVKALNNLVRLRSGEEIDGTALMEKVFSPKAPILSFNDLKDQSDIDEQKGFMMMFSGAVAGLRNPRAHKLIEDDAERALEFVAFVSLLAKLLDGAKKRR